MSAPKGDMLDALDEIDRCNEILRMVVLALQSPAWVEDDFTDMASVVGFTAERIEGARDSIRRFAKSR
jgi:hypothetical protein